MVSFPAWLPMQLMMFTGRQLGKALPQHSVLPTSGVPLASDLPQCSYSILLYNPHASLQCTCCRSHPCSFNVHELPLQCGIAHLVYQICLAGKGFCMCWHLPTRCWLASKRQALMPRLTWTICCCGSLWMSLGWWVLSRTWEAPEA